MSTHPLSAPAHLAVLRRHLGGTRWTPLRLLLVLMTIVGTSLCMSLVATASASADSGRRLAERPVVASGGGVWLRASLDPIEARLSVSRRLTRKLAKALRNEASPAAAAGVLCSPVGALRVPPAIHIALAGICTPLVAVVLTKEAVTIRQAARTKSCLRMRMTAVPPEIDGFRRHKGSSAFPCRETF